MVSSLYLFIYISTEFKRSLIDLQKRFVFRIFRFQLVRFLRNFIQSGPPTLAEFTEFALRRTYRNGNRYEPLSMAEIDAIQQASPLQINVKLIHSDDRRSIYCDSATIAEEACLEIARQLNIQSTFGWSLFAECKNEVTKQKMINY